MKQIILLFILLLPLNIMADTCDDTVYNKKVIEANFIKLQYRYNETESKMYLEAFNVPEDFYFKINNQDISNINRNYDLGTFAEGSTILVNFYNNTDMGCGRGNLVTKRYVVIPYFNKFSNNEACAERTGMAACNRFYPKRLTEAEFNEALYSYDQQIYNLESEIIYHKKLVKDPWYYTYRYYLIGGFISLISIISAVIYYLRLRDYRSEI